MNSINEITIAIPGESRNAKQVKQFLLQQGFIQENDMNLECIYAPKVGVRFIQMRVGEALQFLERNKNLKTTIRGVDGVICGMDQMIERVPYDPDFNGNSIVGFSRDEYDETRDGLAPTENRVGVYEVPFILDDEKSTKIEVFVPQDKQQVCPDIKSLGRRGNRGKGIATPYPNLAKKLLSPLEEDAINPDSMISFSIDEVSGKTEALVAAGFYNSGIDVVDTGETIRRNGLVSIGTLFESYPADIFSQARVEQDANLQRIVAILTEASNNAYYNSSRYRECYPRG